MHSLHLISMGVNMWKAVMLRAACPFCWWTLEIIAVPGPCVNSWKQHHYLETTCLWLHDSSVPMLSWCLNQENQVKTCLIQQIKNTLNKPFMLINMFSHQLVFSVVLVLNCSDRLTWLVKQTEGARTWRRPTARAGYQVKKVPPCAKSSNIK